MRKLLIGAAGSFALAACDEAPNGPMTFQELADTPRAEAITTLVAEDGYTDLASLPVTGTAEYQGIIGIGLGEDPNFEDTPESLAGFGDLAMVVNLEANTVDGRADNFIDAADGRTRGFLDLNGSIDRDVDLNDFFAMFGTMNGTLIEENGRVIVVTSTASGDFYGEDGEFFVGKAEGDAFVDGAQTGFYASYALE